MSTIVRPALVLFAALTVICGVVYPFATAGIGQLAFSDEVNGSIVERGGKPVGSTLIGQSFTSPKYFWGRPSATAPMANNGAGSGGSNQGPTNPALVDAVKARIAALKEADPGNTRADSRRPGNGVGQRPGSGNQPGRRPVPGAARGPRARHAAGAGGKRHRQGAENRVYRLFRRTARECAGTESGARCGRKVSWQRCAGRQTSAWSA